MNDKHIPMSWDHPQVERYEETIALKIPGYAHMYEMTDRLIAAYMNTTQPNEGDRAAKLLIVGAGGGQELVTFGSRHQDWSFTGIDPSARMLEIAKARVERAGLSDRVSFVQGTIQQLPEGHAFTYDAAACMLVLHFVSGRSQKKELLCQIAERLKPGAPLCLASINGEPGTAAFEMQMQAWRSHMLDNGISEQEWERFAASIGRESDPVSSSSVLELLGEAGFIQPVRYFGSYFVEAWCAVKQ
ncbi:class I SAM-dependent methyltransferase [Paenibacillus tyrfis]|uniref:class I SAM-dependent methyltransferase n=1 Tax=Paenibacillus tyrfis TaxID=1501230 RepID=UPI00209E56B1|nr:class I SAM-dependent methyltransferase [Paenibacillus tyrfis]MCP1305772.1 methyltransferase domain-containing protein [Paenibacillus tyrfis]